MKVEFIKKLPPWAEDMPYQVKSLAIREAIINLKTQKKKASQTGKPFRMKFKNRKDAQQSCYIPNTSVTKKGVFPRLAGKLRYTESLPSVIKDSRLVHTNNRYYISVPTEKNRSLTENQGRVVAIDPGIRKFMTFVSGDSAGMLGSQDIGRIYRLCYYLDTLVSKISNSKGQLRRSMRKAASRMRAKIKNLIKELHCKVAKFFVDNYDVILLPTFRTSEMVIKKQRKIRSKAARAMLTFSFYKFSQRLKQKAFECGKTVIDVCEAYTSKTNNFTGVIDAKLGGKKRIPVGGSWVDRDINGALGILLKALGDLPELRGCLKPQFAIVNEC